MLSSKHVSLMAASLSMAVIFGADSATLAALFGLISALMALHE
ncbi:MAG: hypothetical protein ACI93B_002168 [Yoonia sp.]|jgi:hypothetical protein